MLLVGGTVQYSVINIRSPQSGICTRLVCLLDRKNSEGDIFNNKNKAPTREEHTKSEKKQDKNEKKSKAPRRTTNTIQYTVYSLHYTVYEYDAETHGEAIQKK